MTKSYVGEKYGKLTIIEINHIKKPTYYSTEAVCLCDCGNITTVELGNLRTGKTTSCGCWKATCYKHGILHKKHGLSDHPLHNIWTKIKTRCYNPHDTAYKYYGERGISMCDTWKDDFYEFYTWAVNNGYKQGLSIDRIDNNQGYSPENCRWATKKTQANNRRSNRIIYVCGKKYTLQELADKYKIKRATLSKRIEMGWSLNKALNTPVIH